MTIVHSGPARASRMVLAATVIVLSSCFMLSAPPWTTLVGAQDDPKPNLGQPPQNKATDDREQIDLGSPRSALAGMIERYGADHGSLGRSLRVANSPKRDARMKQFYGEWQGALEQVDFEALALDGRVDYLLFKNHLRHELRQLAHQEKLLEETGPLIPFAHTIIDLEEARRQMEDLDSAQAAGVLAGLKKQVDQTRKAVEAGLKSDYSSEGIHVSKSVANRAAEKVSSLKRTLKDWFGFYDGYDPIFTWWASEPYKELDQALDSYAKFLREKVAGVKPGDKDDIVGDPIGREELTSELATEMIPYTPEELVTLADQEYAWCEAEMKRAARDMRYGDDWHKALEHVKTLHVEPGKQPKLIHDLALEAIDFLDRHDLVTIPRLARETWRMEMMSPERQLVNPFFTGGEVISVSYPTNTMTHEQKMMSMRGNNIHFARATVHHELIPGHHLQIFMAARYRPYRRAFSTPFSVEGWALYWELLLWDMDFPRSPEDRIGMLFWRMHRCARIIFSLNFHLGQMSPQECIDFLVERAGHEVDNATAEVRRSFNGSYGPLYQSAYLLGGLQLRALRRELVDTGKMTDRAFHDAVLKENTVPIEMVRASLTKQELNRDFATTWKFYGPLTGKD